MDNLILLRKETAACRRVLRQAKRKGWRDLCTTFNHMTPTSAVWRLVKSFKKRHFSSSHSSEEDNQLVQYETIAKLCPPSCRPSPPPPLETMLDRDLANSSLRGWMEAPFASSEFNSAKATLKAYSAPGLNQIDNQIINALPESYSEHVLKVFNLILAQGSFPPQWRKSLVALIPKPGNRGYRPISLISCLLKLMEKMIYNRLQWFIETNNILPANQFGFRTARACTDNLIILTNHIRSAFIENRYTVAVFLDIILWERCLITSFRTY